MEKKLLRRQKIAVEAAKQCGRSRIPTVCPLMSFSQAVQALGSMEKEMCIRDRTGFCDRDCMQLFEYFGYISGNQYTVPVFRQNAKSIIQRLSNIVIDCIGIDIKKLLSDSPIMFQLYCRRHGVPKEEVANEVYHMIFGMLNEELVSRGFVQMPDFHVGEGRYLKSIELYNNESSTC